MINLLPPNVKQDYTYARRNTVLRHWVIGIVFGLLGIAAIASFGMFTMQQSVNTYSSKVAIAQKDLDKQNIKGAQKKVQDITNSLKLVNQVLSREVLFSQLLKQIATVIPKNVNLTGLSISQVQGAGIDLSAVASDYTAATQLQLNLQDPANKLFSKADIIGITCSTSNAVDKTHPCTVTLRAQFANNNPYLLINNKSTSSETSK